MVVNSCYEDLEGRVGLKRVWKFVPEVGKKRNERVNAKAPAQSARPLWSRVSASLAQVWHVLPHRQGTAHFTCPTLRPNASRLSGHVCPASHVSPVPACMSVSPGWHIYLITPTSPAPHLTSLWPRMSLLPNPARRPHPAAPVPPLHLCTSPLRVPVLHSCLTPCIPPPRATHCPSLSLCITPPCPCVSPLPVPVHHPFQSLCITPSAGRSACLPNPIHHPDLAMRIPASRIPAPRVPLSSLVCLGRSCTTSDALVYHLPCPVRPASLVQPILCPRPRASYRLYPARPASPTSLPRPHASHTFSVSWKIY